MNQGISVYGPREWSEAKERAEIYLRALHGTLGDAERQLAREAEKAARARQSEGVHPVALMMEALFALLPAGGAPVAMAPPIERVSMLPERTEFPLHDGWRRFFRTCLVPFAGAH